MADNQKKPEEGKKLRTTQQTGEEFLKDSLIIQEQKPKSRLREIWDSMTKDYF